LKAIGGIILLFSFLTFREITLAWLWFTIIGVLFFLAEGLIESR